MDPRSSHARSWIEHIYRSLILEHTRAPTPSQRGHCNAQLGENYPTLHAPRMPKHTKLSVLTVFHVPVGGSIAARWLVCRSSPRFHRAGSHFYLFPHEAKMLLSTQALCFLLLPAIYCCFLPLPASSCFSPLLASCFLLLASRLMLLVTNFSASSLASRALSSAGCSKHHL